MSAHLENAASRRALSMDLPPAHWVITSNALRLNCSICSRDRCSSEYGALVSSLPTNHSIQSPRWQVCHAVASEGCSRAHSTAGLQGVSAASLSDQCLFIGGLRAGDGGGRTRLRRAFGESSCGQG